MKKLTKQSRSRWLILCLLSLLMTLGGVNPAWGATLTENFNSTLPTGWSIVGDLIQNSDRARSGNGVWTSSKSDNANYLIIEAVEGSITFYARAYNKSTDAYVIVYKYNGSALGDQLYTTGNMKTSSTPSFASKTASLGDYKGQVAIALNYAAIDDLTYTQKEKAASGPGFVVKDGSTTLESPYTYSFGLATAGTTKVFKLTNPGTEATPISVNTSGANGFTATVEDNATSIPAGGEKTLTITMPDATASGSIVVTPTGAGLSAFTFNVSGTFRDPNKVYLDFSDGQIPDGWSSVRTGSYGSAWAASEGYISQSGSYSSYAWAFTSPKLNFENGELIAFETAKYGSSAYYNPSVTVEYTTDATGATGWTAIGSAFTDDTYGNWTKRSVTIPVDGVKRIRFNGWYIHMRNIYGGELPLEPKMLVTQPATLDFGLYEKDADPAPTKTFTISNTGLATLNGISVSSGNSVFTITNAPTSLAAGASQDVIITMSTATAGALSSLITVSATDMTDATFTVTGAVKPAGMAVEEFTDGLPANWTNASWTFANGEATGKSSSAYLTTPKLTFSAGDFIIVKAKRYDSDTSDYLTVQGSNDNGSTWTAYSKKLQNADGLSYPDYGTMVLSDIPTTINKLRFVGYYAIVDEIYGLNYAPVLSVTKEAAAVASGSTHDFGETTANASVTYNFANSGAGTINITGVAITDKVADSGAKDAYSTNWTESTAAPFDLTITRSYDAGRAGEPAMEAVVTVTTSEGDYVINVTGTDKAANDPELTITLGSDPVTSGDAANFGTKLKAAPAAKTYTITNSGTGTLTGTIATSDDTQFTISKTSFSLGAAESTTFDLSLVFNTTYGAKAATITIHPTNDGLNDGSFDITINASASTLNPETWTEDFAAGTLPTGWVITPGSYSGDTYAWHIGTFSSYGNQTNMAIAPTNTTYNTIITPRLAAKEDDVLTWDAYFNWSDEYMTVEWSNDGTTGWTTIYNQYKPEDESISSRYYYKEMSFTAPADGNYYLRFTSRYSNGIDNFEGFKLNPKTHDAAITAKSIPASGNQYVEYTASVTVKELLDKDDEVVTAELWIGSTKVATEADVTLNANTTKEIELTFTPDAAMSGDAYIKVYNGDESINLTSAVQAVTIAAALVLDESTGPSVALSDGSAPSVVVNYTAKAGWNTICMPFALTTDDMTGIFGAGWKAYTFKSYNTNVLTFEPTTTFYAGYPFVVYSVTPANTQLKKQNVTIDPSANNDEHTFTFQGTYAPMVAGTLTDKWGLTAAGKIAKAKSTTTMKGFRGYFEGDLAGARVAFLGDDDTTTGISVISVENPSTEGVYNLQGQKVDQLKKGGIYIINGKKVVK